jgi:cytoskeletal protein RodZ
MERGPMALFGAIVAVGLGPALWLGAQFGSATVTPERPPAIEANQDQKAPGGAGAAPDESAASKPKRKSGYVPLSSTPSARPSASTTTETPEPDDTEPTTDPTSGEPTPSDEPTTQPTEENTEPTGPPTGDPDTEVPPAPEDDPDEPLTVATA